MPPTSRVVQTEIQNLLNYLIEQDIALYAQPVVARSDVVSWPQGHGSSLPIRDVPTITDYRDWLSANAYSAVLLDGALLQLTYECIGRELTAHRLAYVPAPFAMDQELLAQEPLLDVFDSYAAGSTADVVLATTIRFDYDPETATAGHPATHLTINSACCRIACAGPLRLGRFIQFVFGHFYPELVQEHTYLRSLATLGWAERTITDDEVEGPHMAWRL